MNNDKGSYDGYASVYDLAVGDRSEITKRIQDYIRQYAPQCQSVLEVACGTGSVMAGLDPGYRLVGVDASADMLKVAQAKVPRASFFHGDMSNFWLNQQFDVVYCTSAIYYLLQFSAWQSMFKCVAAHLKPGGIFIFDVNTLATYEALEKEGSWPVDLPPGQSIFVRFSREMQGNQPVWLWSTDIMRINGNDVSITTKEFRTTTFPPEQIKAELEKNFTVEQAIEDQDDPFDGEDAGKTFYICRKKMGGSTPNVITPTAPPEPPAAQPPSSPPSDELTQGTSLSLR